jgi:hypothetical protein
LREEVFNINSEDQIHLPINLRRIIMNARSMFEIGKTRTKTDLTPQEVIDKVQQTMKDIAKIPLIQKAGNKHLQDEDPTMLLRIYLGYHLASKNIIINERLTS